MMCNICHREYSSPSFGGPGVCPACDCGIHPDTVRVRELAAELAEAKVQIEAHQELMAEDTHAYQARIRELEAALRGVLRVADRNTVEFDAVRAALGITSERQAQ